MVPIWMHSYDVVFRCALDYPAKFWTNLRRAASGTVTDARHSPHSHARQHGAFTRVDVVGWMSQTANRRTDCKARNGS